MTVPQHHQEPVRCQCGKPMVCPETLDAEILHINEVLRRNGFEHLSGARGVEAAIDLLMARAVAAAQTGPAGRRPTRSPCDPPGVGVTD